MAASHCRFVAWNTASSLLDTVSSGPKSLKFRWSAFNRITSASIRPNIVVSTGPEEGGFAENDWIGHTVAIGGNVRLAITEPCPRCVMITLPQDDLPKDSGILRTAAQHNAVNVGVYASVLSGGSIRRGDAVTLA